MFGDYIKDFNSNLTDVVQFIGIAILMLGFSNFFWYSFLCDVQGALLII